MSIRPISCSASPRRRQLASSSVLSFCQLAPQVPAPGYRHPVELPRKECARSREEPIGGARDGTLGPAARFIGLAPPALARRSGSGLRDGWPGTCCSVRLLRGLNTSVHEAARPVLSAAWSSLRWHRSRPEDKRGILVHYPLYSTRNPGVSSWSMRRQSTGVVGVIGATVHGSTVVVWYGVVVKVVVASGKSFLCWNS